MKSFRALEILPHSSFTPILPTVRFQCYNAGLLNVAKPKRVWAVSYGYINTSTGLFSRSYNSGLSGILAERLQRLQPRRAFAHIHSSSPSNGPYGPSGPPKIKVLKLSNGAVVLGVFGFVAILLLTVSVVISLLFPLIIVGMSIKLLKSWKFTEIHRHIHKALQLSTLKMSSKTWAELQKRNFERIFPAGVTNMEQLFRASARSANVGSFNIQHDQSAADRANRLLVFMQNRIDKSFAADEQGIRTFFLGKRTDISSIEVDNSSPSLSLSRLGDDRVASINYPAYLIGEETRTHVGKVSIVILEDTAAWAARGDFMSFVLGMEQHDKFYPMVIAVSALSPFSTRVFLISDIGDSNRSNYSVRKTEKGHREFTYHENYTDL